MTSTVTSAWVWGALSLSGGIVTVTPTAAMAWSVDFDLPAQPAVSESSLSLVTVGDNPNKALASPAPEAVVRPSSTRGASGSISPANAPTVRPLPVPTPPAVSDSALKGSSSPVLPPPPPPAVPASTSPTATTTVATTSASPAALDPLFAGEADSLVARAIGHAEGTRSLAGGKTAAYYGHRDPGNGAWNLGSFSYQHGAATPEAADARQLQRLRRQATTLRQRAGAQQVPLSLMAELNGLDLANQSPLAALGTVGYVERLKQAQELGMPEAEAIVWARTRAFLDPDSQRWNAPGLGNTVQTISRDQQRRYDAIAQVLAQESLSLDGVQTDASRTEAAPSAPASGATEVALADIVLTVDLPDP